jgi:SAM-dependent methyltransferase
MDDDDAAAYGHVWADFLDEWIVLTDSHPTPHMGDRINEWAAGGRILELGIGTGHLAIPLAERGLHVEGIDGSPRMLELLAAKPAGASIQTYVADFSDYQLGSRYDLIFFGSSSLFCLPDADAQVRCFTSTARHLADGGLFVVAAYVPDDRWYTDNRLEFVQAKGDGWRMHWDAIRDPVAQVVTVDRRFERNGEEVRHFPHRERYCGPGELDLMARLAGLQLVDRWGGWDRSAFTGEGEAISIYRASPPSIRNLVEHPA